MCGITGIAAHPQVMQSEKERKLLLTMYEVLLYAIENRGRHATGSAAITPDNGYTLLKLAAPAKQVIKSEAWTKHLEAFPKDITVLMGHTRHATHGANSNDNAHPFVMGSVIGCHNGIVYNYVEIAKELGVKPWDVDSQAIFAMLDAKTAEGHHRFGPIGALANVDGYFSAAWWKDGKLSLARSETADLTVAYVRPIKSLVWNSSKQNVLTVLKECGFDDRHVDLWEPKTDAVYEFDTARFTNESTFRTIYEGAFVKSRRSQFNGARPGQPVPYQSRAMVNDVSWPKRGYDPLYNWDEPRGQSKKGALSLKDLDERLERIEQAIGGINRTAMSAFRQANEAMIIAGSVNTRNHVLRTALDRVVSLFQSEYGLDDDTLKEVQSKLDEAFRLADSPYKAEVEEKKEAQEAQAPVASCEQFTLVADAAVEAGATAAEVEQTVRETVIDGVKFDPTLCCQCQKADLTKGALQPIEQSDLVVHEGCEVPSWL